MQTKQRIRELRLILKPNNNYFFSSTKKTASSTYNLCILVVKTGQKYAKL